MPGSGLSLENWLQGLPLNTSPPSMTGEMSATSTTPLISGSSASMASLIQQNNLPEDQIRVIDNTLRSKCSPAESMPDNRRASDTRQTR